MVQIDGYDINNIPSESLRENIGYCPQNIQLFSGTIYENISSSKNDASEEEDDLFYSGGTIILDHGYGVSSSFLHLSEIVVKVGQRVKHGDVIGLVGSTGRSTGPHLDWRMNWFDVRIDPELVLRVLPNNQ